MNVSGSRLLAFSFLMAGITSAQATPFQNGSFESTDVSGTVAVASGDNTTITGWTASSVGAAPTFNMVYISDAPQSYLLSPTDGNQVVALNDDPSGNVSSITQTFDTIASQPYQVLFDLSREVDTSNTDVLTPQISVLATGGSSSNYTVTVGSWVGHTYSFTATGASTTLTFSRTSAGETFSPVLDNVRVNAVPERGAFAMLLFGVLGLGRFWRRRIA